MREFDPACAPPSNRLRGFSIRHRVRRLPVVDEDRRLVGIVSRVDLVVESEAEKSALETMARAIPGCGGGKTMTARCEVCGNEYDKAFEVIAAGAHHVFDSFECAIHRMAPICEHCGCRVIGHGVEATGHFYCCAYCARAVGVEAAAIRA